MKRRKIFTRIMAAILVAILALGIIVPAVSATEMDVDVMQTTTSSIQLCDLPEGFDHPAVTVFIGNMETYKVQYVDLLKENNYMATVNLVDGYYIVYANNYSWCDSNDNAYAINGGSYVYMYIGDQYDQNPYSVQFLVGNDTLKLNMKTVTEGFQNIKYSDTLTVTTSDMIYPVEAMLEKDNDSTIINGSQNQETNDDNNELSFFGMILRKIKESSLLLIALIVCAVVYKVITIKKKLAANKQMEDDMLDDRHIR